MSAPFQILLYYRYTFIDDPAAFTEAHRQWCGELGLRGRILVAAEGINGTVSGPVEATEHYRESLSRDPRFEGITFKVDPAEDHVFAKLSVKCREEIVTLGLEEGDDIDPGSLTGKRLSPREWLEQLHRDDVVVIDARNNYESDLGRFAGAICPDLEHFRDFPAWVREHREAWKGRKVLTYCTGGVRCEKFSGLLRREGIEDVGQLEGGIIAYSRDPSVLGRDFEGLCYVFDERVGVEVNHTETRKIVSQCEKCVRASARYRNCAKPECNRQFFLCEDCEETKGRFCSPVCEAEKAGV